MTSYNSWSYDVLGIEHGVTLDSKMSAQSQPLARRPIAAFNPVKPPVPPPPVLRPPVLQPPVLRPPVPPPPVLQPPSNTWVGKPRSRVTLSGAFSAPPPPPPPGRPPPLAGASARGEWEEGELSDKPAEDPIFIAEDEATYAGYYRHAFPRLKFHSSRLKHHYIIAHS